MTYQSFDEKLQCLFEMNAHREQKLRARWRSISRRGLLVYVATCGLAIFVLVLVWLVFFAWHFHVLHDFSDPIILCTDLACMLAVSLFLPLILYACVQGMVANLDRRAAQAARKARKAV